MMLFGSSVELFVYLTAGIWRGPRTNRQYPTPSRHISERYMRVTVMSVCIALLVL